MRATIDKFIDMVLDMICADMEQLKRAWEKKRYGYVIYCMCIILLWCMLAVSIVCEMVTGCSAISHIWCSASLPAILSIEAVRRTAETVGFGSILIAWIYAALDKEELGFKYSELLRAMYPTYSRFVIGHLIAMLLCVWLVECGMLEGALLSLALIIMGGVIHWRAISSLMFNSFRRKRIAIDEWNRRIDEWNVPDKKGENEKFHHQSLLFGMADTISIHDRDSAEPMQHCLARAMSQFAAGFDGKAIEQREQILSDISYLWDRVTRGRSAGEQTLVLDGLLQACIQEAGSESEATLGPICTGYILWRYKSGADAGGAEQGGADLERLLFRLHSELSSIHARFCNTPVVRYVDEVFTLLAWMHFLNGTVRLLDRFFSFSPKETKRDQELLQSIAGCVFPASVCEMCFGIAFQQTFVSDPKHPRANQSNEGGIT